ncbi:MAG: heat-inducible transcription repressor HrcA [Thiomargarita sp.]|nr:heat-inducible transcription repressor HrcA [Thiomargarita sp.]
MSNATILNERAQHLLKVLVDRYIREGQPIGSRTLSRDARLDLSPATIRNVMADLEGMGLVRSPHTSAGRIPTTRGYRLFVDTLLQINPIQHKQEQHLKQQLIKTSNAQHLLEQTSSLLSEITNLVGVVMLPTEHNYKCLQHIEFLLLGKKRVLVILVFNDNDIENRVIHTSRPYSAAELQNIANYLNENFIGQDIKTVCKNLLQDLTETHKNMQNIVEITEKAFDNCNKRDFVMTGQTNLMEIAEMSNVEKLRDLFIVFNKKRDILHLFEQSLNAQGLKIFIGEELGGALCGCSIIASPYIVKEKTIGVLGVIGPTRMSYGQVIPIVDLTAKLLGLALNHN